MSETPSTRDETILTITPPRGGAESGFLTESETSALAQFVKRVGWFEFASNAVDEDEAHLVKQAFDKLQDVLARAGYSPR